MNGGPWNCALEQPCWKGYNMVGNGTDLDLKTGAFPTIPCGLTTFYLWIHSILRDKH